MELLKMVPLYMMEILTLAAPPLMAFLLFLMCLRRLMRLLGRTSWRIRRRMRMLLGRLLQMLLLRG